MISLREETAPFTAAEILKCKPQILSQNKAIKKMLKRLINSHLLDEDTNSYDDNYDLPKNHDDQFYQFGLIMDQKLTKKIIKHAEKRIWQHHYYTKDIGPLTNKYFNPKTKQNQFLKYKNKRILEILNYISEKRDDAIDLNPTELFNDLTNVQALTFYELLQHQAIWFYYAKGHREHHVTNFYIITDLRKFIPLVYRSLQIALAGPLDNKIDDLSYEYHNNPYITHNEYIFHQNLNVTAEQIADAHLTADISLSDLRKSRIEPDRNYNLYNSQQLVALDSDITSSCNLNNLITDYLFQIQSQGKWLKYQTNSYLINKIMQVLPKNIRQYALNTLVKTIYKTQFDEPDDCIGTFRTLKANISDTMTLANEWQKHKTTKFIKLNIQDENLEAAIIPTEIKKRSLRQSKFAHQMQALGKMYQPKLITNISNKNSTHHIDLWDDGIDTGVIFDNYPFKKEQKYNNQLKITPIIYYTAFTIYQNYHQQIINKRINNYVLLDQHSLAEQLKLIKQAIIADFDFKYQITYKFEQGQYGPYNLTIACPIVNYDTVKNYYDKGSQKDYIPPYTEIHLFNGKRTTKLNIRNYQTNKQYSVEHKDHFNNDILLYSYYNSIDLPLQFVTIKPLSHSDICATNQEMLLMKNEKYLKYLENIN